MHFPLCAKIDARVGHPSCISSSPSLNRIVGDPFVYRRINIFLEQWISGDCQETDMVHITPRLGIVLLLMLVSLCAGMPIALAQSASTIVLTEIVAQPLPTKAAYEITAYASVVNDEGQPITGLQK